MNFHDVSGELWNRIGGEPQHGGIDGFCPREKSDTILATVLAFKPKVCVEAGVYAGRSLCVIGLSLKYAGIEGATLHGIDSWKASDMVASYDQQSEKEHWTRLCGAGVLTRKKHDAFGWVESLGLNDIVTIKEASIDDAIPTYADGSIDLLHLDAGKSFDDSMRHSAAWLPKVKTGGVIIVDDTDWPTARAAYMRLRMSCRELYEVRFHGEQAFAVLVKE